MNAFRNLYGVFRASWRKTSLACGNYYAGPIVHGNTGHRNHFTTSSVALSHNSGVSFLSNIADEYGELYATHFVREVTGMSLRDTEEGCIDLPSHFSKRHFYAQYCYHQGYKVKANAKGSYDSMSEYKLQVLMIRYGPRAVSPSPFAHGSIFSAYGKQNFTS